MRRKTKRSIFELAIMGGRPALAEPLYLGTPNIGNRQQFFAYINDALDRRWITNNGPLVQQFERRLAELIGVKYCMAICNGTSALQIAIKALNLTGDVILPSFTFVATAHALKWQGINPVFCDINSKTHCIDPVQVESLITPKTSGIIGVHLWGRSCDVKALEYLAKKYELKLLYDASHALGGSSGGEMIGSFGDAEVFSFHATKTLNTFEGGAIVTNNETLMHKIKRMRNFGFANDGDVMEVGINGKMSELSAAMGLVNLDSLDRFISVNAKNYTLYQQSLQEIKGLTIFQFEEQEKCSFQYVPVEIGSDYGLSRDHLIAILREENVLVKRYFYPGCHRMKVYMDHGLEAELYLPCTEKVADRIILLPTGASVDSEAIHTIAEIIRLAGENCELLRRNMLLRHV